jgi:hypothetical protein
MQHRTIMYIYKNKGVNTKMTIRHAYPFGYHQCEDSEKEDGVLQCVLYLLMISFVVNS